MVHRKNSGREVRERSEREQGGSRHGKGGRGSSGVGSRQGEGSPRMMGMVDNMVHRKTGNSGREVREGAVGWR